LVTLQNAKIPLPGLQANNQRLWYSLVDCLWTEWFSFHHSIRRLEMIKRNWSIKLMLGVLLTMIYGVGFVPQVAAQSEGDYRSASSGNWSDNSTWERFDGTVWQPASTSPTNADGVITIRDGDTVNISSDVVADQVVIEANAEVIISSSAIWTIADGPGVDLYINGTVLNLGRFVVNSPANWSLNASGTFIHNSATAIATTIGRGSLHAASNFIYRGSSALIPSISIAGRTYGHLTIESTSGLLTLSSPSGTTALNVQGNLSVGMTGDGTVSYQTVGYSGNINITGNLAIGNESILRIGASTTTVGGNLVNGGHFVAPSPNTLIVNGSLTNGGTVVQTLTVIEDNDVFFFNTGGYGGIKINANNLDLGSTTVAIHGNRPCDTEYSSVWRCFDIDAANSTARNATVTFYFAADELNGQTCTNLKAWRWTGSEWDFAGNNNVPDCSEPSPYLIVVPGISEFSYFVLSDLEGGPTAVQLISLQANTVKSLEIGVMALILLLAGTGSFLWRRYPV
jgi:hypothetical protein